MATGIEPIKLFQVDELSDVVVIAGPNGVGKSRLLSWLLNHLQNLPSHPENWVIVEATSPRERQEWGKSVLDSRTPDDAAKLRTTLQRPRHRYGQTSSLLNFESDRKITQVKPYNFDWNYSDPYLEQVGWNYGFGGLTSRYNDTVHTIFRKIRSRREAMMSELEDLDKIRRQSGSSAAGQVPSIEGAKPLVSIDMSKFPDPMDIFKEAFAQLLAPKELVQPDPTKQQLFYRFEGNEYPLTSLSSGEREVVNIVFDFLLRNPTDCIVIFDEPELHLHPELGYRLINTLKSVGSRNQFVFCTHSAEIISASLDSSVVFITPPKIPRENQAVMVRENDDTHQALRLIGQSIGIVSLGKKIVLIEGQHGSLDKETYGAILEGRFSDLVLVPSGGKELIQSFASFSDRILKETVWGVDFYMLCDRDAVPATRDTSDLETAANNRLRVLNRYHLENYFLDENIIGSIFESMESEDSWLRSPDSISAKLKEIAKESISYAAALIVSAEFRERVGNLDIMPSACHGKSSDELVALVRRSAESEQLRISKAIDLNEIQSFTERTMVRLENSLDNGTSLWKRIFPGRTILTKFCSKKYAGFDFGRFKTAYIRAANDTSLSPFKEIEDIFRSFSSSRH